MNNVITIDEVAALGSTADGRPLRPRGEKLATALGQMKGSSLEQC
jgi:hypothetical protein